MAAVFAGMGNATQFVILMLFAKESYSVGDIARFVGGSRAHVSRQPGLLKSVGLEKCVRSGKSMIYSTDGPDIDEIISLTHKLFVNTSING